ncbi:hypothetical protein Tco_0164879 [Tanacetum coccineum]
MKKLVNYQPPLVFYSPDLLYALHTTTLREPIDSEGRLNYEVLVPGVPRFAIPRGSRPSKQDLYDRMGSMKIRQGEIEGCLQRTSYHWYRIEVIMEYLVKISKKARILELKRRHLKITVLTSNTSYPTRKIRCICACTSQRPQGNKDEYAVFQKVVYYAVVMLW